MPLCTKKRFAIVAAVLYAVAAVVTVVRSATTGREPPAAEYYPEARARAEEILAGIFGRGAVESEEAVEDAWTRMERLGEERRRGR